MDSGSLSVLDLREVQNRGSGTRVNVREVFDRLMRELREHSVRLHSWFLEMLQRIKFAEADAVKGCARFWKTQPQWLTGSQFVAFVKLLVVVAVGIERGN